MKIKIIKEAGETFSMSRKGNAGDTFKPETTPDWYEPGILGNKEESEEISDPDWSLNTVDDDPNATVELPKGGVVPPHTGVDMSAGEVKRVLDAHALRNTTPMDHLRNVGFENVDYLGRGQFGFVYSADHPSGREMAVKAVNKHKDGHDRELRAYRTIGQARDKSDLIAKHFPLIYAVDTESHDQYSFIAMERLTDEGPYAEIVNDVFSGGEYLVHARGDLMARGAWKDLSRRIKTYFGNDQARDKIIDVVFEGTPDDFIEDIKIWANSWQSWREIMPHSEDGAVQDKSPRYLAQRITQRILGMVAAEDGKLRPYYKDLEPLTTALRRGYYYDALEIMQKEMDRLQNAPEQGEHYARDKALKDFYKRTYKKFHNTGVWLDQMIDEYVLYNDRDALQDEFGGLKREFEEEPWMVYFILGALKKLKEYRPTETDPIWQDTKKGEPIEDFYWRWSTSIVNGWVNFIRKQAPIGIHHKPEPERQDRGGAPDEVGDAYEEVRSIKKALNELERITDLAARDMHDKNVMMRPIDGSIVIVDVGMFKPRSEIKTRAQRALNETKSELRERFYDEVVDFDFSFDDFRPQTGLHPSFWDKEDLFDDISRNLKLIAKEYSESIGIEDHLEDILVVGSLASYNWHKKSDIDLHLVVDFDKIDKNEDMVEELMRLHRMRWNDEHNIRIYGHEVEVYVQDIAHKGHYAGIYSLQTDEWLKKPRKEDPEIDFGAISTKAASLADEINDIDVLYRKNYLNEAYMKAESLKKKIRDMRQAGLDGEGTYSVENLAFKVLRNNGFLQRLSKIRHNSYDIMRSIGESPIIKLKIGTDLNEKRKKRRKKGKKGRMKVSYSNNPHSKKGYTGKNHWNVGTWWYNGTSGGDSGGDSGGGE